VVKISVITVTFKDIAGLELTRESLATQGIDFEWIIIDGGTSGFKETSFISDSLVSCVVSEPDAGIYDAMRKGLACARGEFVLFLNSGDTLVGANTLRTLVRNLGDEGVHYFAAAFTSNGRTVGIRYPRSSKYSIWHSVPGNQQATIYRRSLLGDMSVVTRYKVCGDYALAATLDNAGVISKYSRLVVCQFALGGRSTTDIWALCNEAWLVQREILGLPLFFRAFSYVLRLATTGRTLLMHKISSWGRG
jgi:putative colanic acid biosynthesis glycosyltransferase